MSPFKISAILNANSIVQGAPRKIAYMVALEIPASLANAGAPIPFFNIENLNVSTLITGLNSE